MGGLLSFLDVGGKRSSSAKQQRRTAPRAALPSTASGASVEPGGNDSQKKVLFRVFYVDGQLRSKLKLGIGWDNLFCCGPLFPWSRTNDILDWHEVLLCSSKFTVSPLFQIERGELVGLVSTKKCALKLFSQNAVSRRLTGINCDLPALKGSNDFNDRQIWTSLD